MGKEFHLDSPLIAGSEEEEGALADHDDQNMSRKWCIETEILTELRKQLFLAGPLVVVSFLQFSLQMISVMFVGHLGELTLAGASMATSFAGVTGFSLMLGMGSALETLCGQAYGAGQHHMLGLYTQRAMLITALVSLPVSILWSYTGKIFLTLNQDPEISLNAAIYAKWLIPSILPYGILQCQMRFLQTQNNVLLLTISTGITSAVHILLCWILIIRSGFGSRGAAISIALSYWTNVMVLAMYIKYSPHCQKTWTGFSKDGTKNLLGFLKVGVPSALMVCLEFWSYEALVFMSGFLPNPKLEASMMSVSLNTCSVAFRIPFGFGSVVSTRVSNELGANNPRAAKLAVKIVMFLAVTEGLSLSLIAFSVRDIWGCLYSNDEDVIRYIAAMMPVLAVSNFMDGIQGVLSGTARGCGRQNVGALVNLGSYYLVGLPSATILTFVFHFGGKGLWMGIISGSSLQAILFLIITITTNWEQEAMKARDRVNSHRIPETMLQ